MREHTLFADQAQASAGESGKPSSGAAGAASGGGGAGGAGTAGAGESGGAAGNAGSSGQGNPTGPPWSRASCVAALSAGKNGDPCLGDFICNATAECCQLAAVCKGKTLVVSNDCTPCETICSTDAECGFGQLCDNYRCLACPKDPCPASWTSVLRNGCQVCVPANECKSDQECQNGLVCGAGLSCLPGCKADPACCFGNRCVSAGCTSFEGLDCLQVGCSAGSWCKAGTDAVACKCDPAFGKWVCAVPPSNVCVPR